MPKFEQKLERLKREIRLLEDEHEMILCIRDGRPYKHSTRPAFIECDDGGYHSTTALLEAQDVEPVKTVVAPTYEDKAVEPVKHYVAPTYEDKDVEPPKTYTFN